jgi:hypothetical protein
MHLLIIPMEETGKLNPSRTLTVPMTRIKFVGDGSKF